MSKVFGKTDAEVNVRVDQSMDTLVGLINKNINDPVNQNVNQHIENIKFDIHSFREKIEKHVQAQGSKVDKKLKDIQDLIEDKHDEDQTKFEILQELIADLEKNNFEKLEQSFKKINASFDALALDIGTNKNTLLEVLNVLEQQLITGFSVQKIALLGQIDVQILKILDELEVQHKYQADQWSALSKALEDFSNQHINKLEVQAESISILLTNFDVKVSSKQDYVIEQIIQQVKSSFELSLSKQETHVNQLQELQKHCLNQQTSDLKTFESHINQQFKNHKNTQMITFGISVINLLLISMIVYFGVKW